MQEKSQLQPLKSVYLSCLEEEDDWQRRAQLMLKEVGEALVERQNRVGNFTCIVSVF